MARFVIPFVLAITITGCSLSASEQSDDAQAIAEATKAFSQAYVDGDLEAQMKFYTEDAVILPGSRNMVEGINEVTKYWDTPNTTKILTHKSTPTKLEISGNMASDYGYYEGSSVRNGTTSNFRGQYVIVWKKGADGKWRMAIDMWSGLRDNN